MGLVLHLQLLQRHYLTCGVIKVAFTHIHVNTHISIVTIISASPGTTVITDNKHPSVATNVNTHPPQPPAPNTGLETGGEEALACVALYTKGGCKQKI
jgi:hypothetical protein